MGKNEQKNLFAKNHNNYGSPTNDRLITMVNNQGQVINYNIRLNTYWLTVSRISEDIFQSFAHFQMEVLRGEAVG
jgi:hypothetical protein